MHHHLGKFHETAHALDVLIPPKHAQCVISCRRSRRPVLAQGMPQIGGGNCIRGRSHAVGSCGPRTSRRSWVRLRVDHRAVRPKLDRLVRTANDQWRHIGGEQRSAHRELQYPDRSHTKARSNTQRKQNDMVLNEQKHPSGADQHM